MVPVGLVVRLPRRHEALGLVAQSIPALRRRTTTRAHSREELGLAAGDAAVGGVDGSAAVGAGLRLVEWGGGQITATRDVAGLDDEEQVRRRFFIRLAPTRGPQLQEEAGRGHRGVPEGGGGTAGAVHHPSTLPSALCRSAASAASLPATFDGAPIDVRAVSSAQLPRLRAWRRSQHPMSGALAGDARSPRKVHRAETRRGATASGSTSAADGQPRSLLQGPLEPLLRWPSPAAADAVRVLRAGVFTMTVLSRIRKIIRKLD